MKISIRCLLVLVLVAICITPLTIFHKQCLFTGCTSSGMMRNIDRWMGSSYNNTDDVTLVTAYFELPTFSKGNVGSYRGAEHYLSWFPVYRNVMNPMIIYTDSDAFFQLALSSRKDRMDKTMIIRTSRYSFWPFKSEKNVTELFKQPGYPKHHPNTVIPAYSLIGNSKVLMLDLAAKENVYHTNYFTWIDAGYFRNIVGSNDTFQLVKPPGFNDSRIAMNEVYNPKFTIKPERIIKNKHDWVGSGIIFGRADVISKFHLQCRRAFEYFLSRHVMNTEQQLIYALYTNEGRAALKPEVELQVYHGSWFNLGFLMRQVMKPHRL